MDCALAGAQMHHGRPLNKIVRPHEQHGDNFMHVQLTDWKNGWSGVEIGLNPREIDLLIERLTMLKNDHDQHFHVSSDYKVPGGIGDIEIYIRAPEQAENMYIGGKAMGAGEEI
jgi:hypothetical protein